MQNFIRIMWLIGTLFLFFCENVIAEMCPPEENVIPCSCERIRNEISVQCQNLESLNQLINSVRKFHGRKIFRFEIRNSKFEYVPHDLFQNISVTEIEISKSIFSRIGNLGYPQFKGLEQTLETLKFKDTFTGENPFAYVAMDHLKNLRTLEVYGCYVGFLHNHFFRSGPKSLKDVRFVKGKISIIGHVAFNFLTGLKIIDLSDNRLNYIARSAFPEPAHSLEELNLERNKLLSLSEDIFTDMPNLRRVNLELNEFSTIDEIMWQPVWNHLEYLNVDYNPIICDSKIKWMYKSNELEERLAGTCYKPFTLMDRELHTLKPEELN